MESIELDHDIADAREVKLRLHMEPVSSEPENFSTPGLAYLRQPKGGWHGREEGFGAEVSSSGFQQISVDL